jgi:hypothetical protein
MMIFQDQNIYEHQMAESCAFWEDCHVNFPSLAYLARLAFTLAASSAAAERVFSMLKRTFTTQQIQASLSDYTEGSIMLQHNA